MFSTLSFSFFGPNMHGGYGRFGRSKTQQVLDELNV